MAEQLGDVQKTIEQAKDALTVRRVFGDPYEKNGVTVIPAARVQGGAGGGDGTGPEGGGKGSGFGLSARPAGAYVILASGRGPEQGRDRRGYRRVRRPHGRANRDQGPSGYLDRLDQLPEGKARRRRHIERCRPGKLGAWTSTVAPGCCTG